MGLITPYTLALAMQKKFAEFGTLAINSGASNTTIVSPRDLGLAIQKAAAQFGIEGITPNPNSLATVGIDHTNLDIVLEKARAILEENSGGHEGRTWETVKYSWTANYTLYDACFGNGEHVAVGTKSGGSNIVIRSSLNNWYDTILAPNGQLTGVDFHDGMFVAVDSSLGRIYYCTNAGVTWNLGQPLPEYSGKAFQSAKIRYGNGMWVVCAWGNATSSGSLANKCFKWMTTDPVSGTWNLFSGKDDGTTVAVKDFRYSPEYNNFLGAGNTKGWNTSGTAAFADSRASGNSPNQWTEGAVSGTYIPGDFNQVAYGKNLYVAVGPNARVGTATDGRISLMNNYPKGITGQCGICYGKSNFILFGTNTSKINISADPYSGWEEIQSPDSGWTCASYGQGYIVYGRGGMIIRSTS